MKIIQINCVFRNGSTGRITENIHKYLLEKGLESIVIYGRGNKFNEPYSYKISSELEAKIHSLLSRLFSAEFGYSPISTKRTIEIIKKQQPDVVHLQILNGNFINVYKLLNYLKENKIKTVLTLHAEIMHTAGCEHAIDCEKWIKGCNSCNKPSGKISRYFRDDSKYCYDLMKNAIQGFDDLTVVGVSQWLTDRAKQSAIMSSGVKFETVHNGVDTNVFHFVESEDLRERLKIANDKKVILHVTPNFNSEIKGGKYVIELAKMMPEYQFIIVGFNGDKNILPSNIIPVKHTKNTAELAQYYSMADCMACTSLRESLPTVCLEAVSCGCKVVAFNSGGITETIPASMGECVSCYNLDEFQKAVQKWSSINVSQEIKDLANKNNSNSFMGEKYCRIYENLL